MLTASATTGIDNALIGEIVRRILSVAQPDKIILFGSAATGPMSRDSDIDLLIVETGPIDRPQEYVRVRRALGSMGFPFDLLFITKDWFEASKNVSGGIAYPAHKHGRVIYEAA